MLPNNLSRLSRIILNKDRFMIYFVKLRHEEKGKKIIKFSQTQIDSIKVVRI